MFNKNKKIMLFSLLASLNWAAQSCMRYRPLSKSCAKSIPDTCNSLVTKHDEKKTFSHIGTIPGLLERLDEFLMPLMLPSSAWQWIEEREQSFPDLLCDVQREQVVFMGCKKGWRFRVVNTKESMTSAQYQATDDFDIQSLFLNTLVMKPDWIKGLPLDSTDGFHQAMLCVANSPDLPVRAYLIVVNELNYVMIGSTSHYVLIPLPIEIKPEDMKTILQSLRESSQEHLRLCFERASLTDLAKAPTIAPEFQEIFAKQSHFFDFF